MATNQAAILWATESDSSDDAVVKLLAAHALQTQTCTGTLVAPNLVLTARHCIADFTGGDFTCNADGDRISGPGGETGTAVTPDKVIVQIGIQPTTKAKDAIGVKIFELPTTTICRNDIALVLLDRNLTDNPYPIRLDRNSTRGELMRGVGYGTFSSTGTGIRHTKSDLPVTKVGKSQFEAPGDGIPPRSFQIEGGGFCIGDSGGPAFSERGAVMGVFSKSTAACTSTDAANHFAETGPYADELIRPAFRASGYEPILETAPFAGTAGAAGASGTAGMAGVAGGIADFTGAGSSAGTSGSISVGGIAGSGGVAGGASSAATRPVQGGSGPQLSATTTGGAIDSTVSTGGSRAPESTEEEVIFDAAPPKGGACDCQVTNRRSSGILAFASFAIAMLLRRRARVLRGTQS